MPTLTNEQFIERTRKVHGDKYNYDRVICKSKNKSRNNMSTTWIIFSMS